MGVTFVDNGGYHGWRVTKKIKPGQEVQKYFSVKRPENFKKKKDYTAHKSEQEAFALKEESKLEKERTKYEKTLPPTYLRSDGSVQGIIFKYEKQKASESPIFQVSCASKVRDGKIFRTSFSIKKHGLDDAWKMAVAELAVHKQVSNKSKDFKDMLKRKDASLARGKVTKRQLGELKKM